MKKFRVHWTILVFALAPLPARASGDEVVVIYNKQVPESKAVAEYYARARQVPEKQIFGFSLTPKEEMSRAEFRDSLQLPLVKKMESAGLWQFGPAKYPGQPENLGRRVIASKIRYAVLCYGVPLKIAADASVQEAGAEKMRSELKHNEASVDSELAWLPLVKMDVLLTGPLPNWAYGATNVTFLNPTNGILLVARLDGPSADIARGLVDKALAAERDGLWGRAYFDARGLPKTDNYFLGDEWILGAAGIARMLGFETVVDDKPETFPVDFPMSQIALYCGWYDENVSGPFTLSKVEFMPGAFAYHLHSFSATTIRSATQNWVGPLLAKGATCTMGCVNEPFLAATPNVAGFLRFFGSGFTFGEAAWAAQPALSWQTTVVGDPLYRPFGKPAQLMHAELLRRHGPFADWSYLRLINLGLGHGVSSIQISGLIENLDATTNSAVLTEKLADLYAAQGKPSSAILTYQSALKLNPSPQQKIRIQLTLGEKLQEQDRDTEAVEDYQTLLAESSDYPGRNSVYKKLLALAQKLGRFEDAERYQTLLK